MKLMNTGEKKGNSHIEEIKYLHSGFCLDCGSADRDCSYCFCIQNIPMTKWLQLGYQRIGPGASSAGRLIFSYILHNPQAIDPFFCMNILAFTMLYLIVGVLGYQWYIMEIAALFLAMGIVAGFASGKKPGEIQSFSSKE